MFADILGILGGVCLVGGATLVAIPAGLIVAGVLLLAAAWRVS